MNNKKINWKKHILIFFLTLLIFSSGFFLSDYLTNKKIFKIIDLQQNLRIDILSLETRFSILSQAPCNSINESFLTEELYNISKKLSSIRGSLGNNDPNFLMLKKYYSILQIKHWLLLKKAREKCKLKITPLIYFYSDEKNCPDCENESYILNYISKKYPELRMYSFDYNLPLSAVQALRLIYGVKKRLPAIIVNNDVYYGFKKEKDIEKILKKYIKEASSTETISADGDKN